LSLLIKIIDPKSNLDIDPIAGKKFIEEQLEKMKADTAKAKVQVDQERNKMEHEKWKHERERNRPRE
jgi:hypothetical protein